MTGIWIAYDTISNPFDPVLVMHVVPPRTAYTVSSFQTFISAPAYQDHVKTIIYSIIGTTN